MKKPVWVLYETVLLLHKQSVALAAGEMSETAFAEWLKANSRRA